MTAQAMGVQSSVHQYSPLTWLSFIAAYQWDNEGRMTSLQYPTVNAIGSFGNMPVKVPTAGYQFDANGRLGGMTMDTGDGSGPQQYASAAYSAAGQLQTLSYMGWTETRTYNSLLQLTGESVPGFLNMTYNYTATANNGRIAGSVDGITGENTAYTYDALNRLTGASNSMWNQTYTYDGFGNLLSKAGSGGSPNPVQPLSVSYDANNHQVGAGASYDANGNQTTANGTSNWFSAENRVTGQASNTWPYPTAEFSYDPWGKRVLNEADSDPQNLESGSDPQYTFNFYGITGQKLAAVTCSPQANSTLPTCGMNGQNVYFGSKMIVAGGVPVLTDRLGSVRYNAQGEQFAYYPYGEERTNRPDGREKFGTYFRDVAGQDYADQRYYGSGTGRFWTADPGGIKTADAGSPLSWNRYAYGNADPVNFRDPTGTEVQFSDGDLTVNCSDDYADSFYDGSCDLASGGGGGGGCYGTGLGFLGQPDPGCPTGGDYYEEPATPPCNPVYQSWITAHGGDAVTIEKALGDSTTGNAGIQGEADVLTLSAMETTWGTNFFARTGDSYFSLERVTPNQYSNFPPLFPYSNGWSGAFQNPQGQWAVMAKYPSYLASGLSFAALYGKAGLLKGVTNPASFISIAQAHGYSGDSTSTFMSIEGGIENCLKNGQ